MRGHHIVVTVKVERALAVAVETEQIVTWVLGISRRLDHLVRESEPVQFRPNAVHALAVIVAWWILSGDFDEVLAKIQDGLFVGIKRLSQVEF
jgi:hypothetical protein